MTIKYHRLWIGSIAVMAIFALSAHLGNKSVVPLGATAMKAFIQPEEIQTEPNRDSLPWWLQTTPWSRWANGLAAKTNGPSGIDVFVSNAGLTTPSLQTLPPAGRGVSHSPRSWLETVPEKLCTLVFTPKETSEADYYIVAEAEGVREETELKKEGCSIDGMPEFTTLNLHLEIEETHFFGKATRTTVSEEVLLEPKQGQLAFKVRDEVKTIDVSRAPYHTADDQDGSVGRPFFVNVDKEQTLFLSSKVDLVSNSTDEILFRGEEERLVILIVSSSALSDTVQCERSGTGQRIGVYSDDASQLVAMTDASSWIKLSARATKYNLPVEYTVCAFSGKAPTDKQAFIEILDTLYFKKPEGVSTDPDRMRSMAIWFAKALDLHFSAEDRDLCHSESQRILINSLLDQKP